MTAILVKEALTARGMISQKQPLLYSTGVKGRGMKGGEE